MYKIQDVLKSLGDAGCLLLCYSELAGISLIDLINNFNQLVLDDIIRDDCYVKDADRLMQFFNIDKKVRKVDVNEVAEDTPYIVPYHRRGFTHFVIAKNGDVIYNTLADSKCVKEGEPDNIVRILL